MGKTKDSWASIAGHKPSSITANSRMHQNLWDVVGSHLSPKLFMPNPFFVGLKEESVVSHSTDRGIMCVKEIASGFAHSMQNIHLS